MYSINGRPLHEGRPGWRVLRRGTQTQFGITKRLATITALGQNGYTPTPSTWTEGVVIFNVRGPRNRLDELLSLVDQAAILTRTDDPTKQAFVELASAIPSGEAPLDAEFDVTVTLNVYEGVWRDADAITSGPTTIVTPSQTVQMFSGLSAPVEDMDVFVRGVFGQFTLTDSAGSFLKTTKAWPGSASTGILYRGASKQAFLANESSPFVPIAEAGNYIAVSGNSGFQLTPKFTGGDPAVRAAELTLVTLTQTNVTLRVRGKRSYRMN